MQHKQDNFLNQAALIALLLLICSVYIFAQAQRPPLPSEEVKELVDTAQEFGEMGQKGQGVKPLFLSQPPSLSAKKANQEVAIPQHPDAPRPKKSRFRLPGVPTGVDLGLMFTMMGAVLTTIGAFTMATWPGISAVSFGLLFTGVPLFIFGLAGAIYSYVRSRKQDPSDSPEK